MWPPDQYWCPRPILGPQKGFKVKPKKYKEIFKNLLLNYNTTICNITMQSSSDSVIDQNVTPGPRTILGSLGEVRSLI